MDVFYLEISADGIRHVGEIHATELGADLRLLSFVLDEWDSEMMGRSSEGVPPKDAIKLFFEVMEEYTYYVSQLEVRGLKPAVQADPYPGMEPVTLVDVELRLIQYALQTVDGSILRKLFNGDYPSAYLRSIRDSLIKKLG